MGKANRTQWGRLSWEFSMLMTKGSSRSESWKPGNAGGMELSSSEIHNVNLFFKGRGEKWDSTMCGNELTQANITANKSTLYGYIQSVHNVWILVFNE